MTKVKYKVFSYVMEIRQQTTTIDLEDIFPPMIYNHITKTLYDRFKGYRVSINHSGRTISIYYKEDRLN